VSLATLTPERYRAAKALLEQLLELAPGARRPALERACGADVTLSADVEELLRAHEAAEAGDFLGRPPSLPSTAHAGAPTLTAGMPLHAPSIAPGQRLGPYRVVREVGRGGMGVVLEAVRADAEFDQTVAVKLVPLAAASDFARRRFLEERQILARLEHPYIARLLDGGTSDEGLPYLVMEFVRGERIDRWCDGRGLDLRARLRLFVQVLEAVHHAHRNLIVHRDLKPGNILVTPEGRPKLLDFGIARLVEPDLGAAADAPTVTAVHALTPEFASPEQARGEPVTTASDVYSLGVLLFELLTGRPPYRLDSRRAWEVLAAVCDQEPERASAAAVRAVRAFELTPEEACLARGAATPALLRRQLAGDLDTIVSKALRKEPGARYSSAEALAEDLQRYLDGQPVLARPPTLGYRAGKFVRRNPATTGLAALALLALSGGLLATAREARRAEAQRQRAERRFADVRRLANTFLFEIHDAVAPLPGSTSARALIVSHALAYLDSLAGEAAGDEALQAELASAFERIGDVQGRPGVASLGQRAAALDSYRRALALRRELWRTRPGDLERGAALAGACEAVARVAPDAREALELTAEALRLRRAHAESRPGDRQVQRGLGLALFARAMAHIDAKEYPDALDQLAAAERVQRPLVEREPAAEDEQALARTLKKQGALHIVAARLEPALRAYREALVLDERRLARDPQAMGARMDVSFALSDIGLILREQGDGAGAVRHYRRVVELRRSVVRDDPRNAHASLSLASAQLRLAAALAVDRRTAEARRVAREGAAGYDAWIAAHATPDRHQGTIEEVEQHYQVLTASLRRAGSTGAASEVRAEGEAWVARARAAAAPAGAPPPP
jgi:non-specific serine/threonine protein kinase/serine/threonine-protein kinase